MCAGALSADYGHFVRRVLVGEVDDANCIIFEYGGVLDWVGVDCHDIWRRQCRMWNRQRAKTCSVGRTGNIKAYRIRCLI